MASDSKKIKMPAICPSCAEALRVSTLTCTNCDTAITGNYPLPNISQLSHDEQELILNFFIKSGSIKDLAVIEQVSYPTMRNRLDDLIAKVQQIINRAEV